jgi:hypothetical protein
MKLSKREKILLILVLIIGSVVGYYFLFYQPYSKEMETLTSQITSDQNTINTNNILKKNIEKVIQDISDDEAKMAEFSESINSAFDQPDVLVYLFNVMENYGYSYKIQINFNDPGNLGQVKLFKISVTMIGSYDEMIRVLNEFASGEHFIKVTALTVAIRELSSGGSAPESGDSAPESGDSTPESGDSAPESGGSAPESVGSSLNLPPGTLNINMELEIYYIGDEIPPDKTYPFTGGAVQYGGDMFG